MHHPRNPPIKPGLQSKAFARPPRREFVPLPEAAARVGRSPRTLRRWIRAGLLPGYAIQGRLLIRLEDLRSLLDGSRVVAEV